ncbi:MAG: VWA domain-containing protein [Elusimicrobiota bacterium]|jgi:Ca-activated chloride channel family protein|nr:VWA domain-containing protein [Elusimicrobiota bacterium]
MRFANPIFLLFFIPFAAFIYWYINSFRKRVYNPSLRFSRINLIKQKYKGNKVLFLKILKLAKFFALLLLIIALARPQEGKTFENSSDQGIDIMIALDTSSSMRSIDFKPLDRMQTAKKVIEEFVKMRKFDRIGLVNFSGLAFTQSPLTTDKESLVEFIKSVEIGDTGLDGTAIGSAIMTSVNRLKDGKAKSKIIILATDGNNNMGEIDPITASEIASQYDIKIYTVGVGSLEGGIYIVDHPFFGRREVRDTENKINEAVLKQISENTGGSYFRALDAKSFENIMKQIDNLEKDDIKAVQFTNYNERYKIFVVFAFLLLLLSVILENTILRKLP